MVLDTLATTGSTPTATSAGQVSRLPDPTTALIAPAATPAAHTASASQTVTATPASDPDRVSLGARPRAYASGVFREPPNRPPRFSSARLISEGTIQILLASPLAISGR